MAIKTDYFTSFEAFDESGTAGEYERVTVIEYNNRFAADLMTETKSLKVALNRFFKAIESYTIFNGWKESIEESCKCGEWEARETFYNQETNKSEYTGSWAYCVEDNDGSFYISLILAK